MADSSRRYTDDEVALILRKAAQLDADGAARDPGNGLSLAEIERIAYDAGISADAVTRAAAQLTGSGSGARSGMLGGPTDFFAEHETAGEVPREHFGDVVAAIRRVMGAPGRASDVLDGLEWRSVGETTQVTVAVRPGDGRTRVQILADRGGSAVIAYLVSMVGALLGGGITGAILEPSAAYGALIMGLAASGGLLGARGIWAAVTRRFRRKFAALVEAVTGEVERHATPPHDDPAS